MRCETRPKAIYIANARIPSEKAHPYQILKMCEAFVKNGIDIELVVPFRVQTNKQMRAIRGVWQYYGIEEKFRITTLPSLDLIFAGSHLLSWIEYLFFYLQASTFYLFAVLYSLLKRGEITYSRDPQFLFVLGLIKPSWRPRMYYEAHTFPGSRVGKRLRLWLGKRIGGLIVITNKLKEVYIELGVSEEKILVAPDGVDLSLFEGLPEREKCRRRLGLPLDRPIIGYIGRFHTMGMEKGIPELVRAMAHLPPLDGRDPLLLCVGGPIEAVSAYLDLARRSGVPEHRLRFVDRVPNKEVPLWIRACDVVTIPWPWTEFSAYFTSPLKLFEYMAAGRSIVASDLPSLREVLRDDENAVLVKPDDPKALAEGIQMILDDPTLASRLAVQARRDVTAYTWEQRAEKIMGFIGGIEEP
jgi:glycosyltransferase involved in cell wall biosynthesis